MKRFLSIFLAISLFFNSGFYFTGVKASIMLVPLSFTDGACYDSSTVSDPVVVLKRLAALEAVLTSFIVQYQIEQNICALDSGIRTGDANVIRQEIWNAKSDFNRLRYTTQLSPSTKAAVQLLAQSRVDEIRAKILSADQRINDLKTLYISIYTNKPLGESVTGVNNSDENEIKQEYYRARAYKGELIDGLEYWQYILQTDSDFYKITSISPSTAMAGQQITIKGTGLDKVIAISFSNALNNFNTGLTINPSDIISPTEIRVTLPSSLTDGVLNVGIINSDDFREAFKANILTISNTDLNLENSCKCPPGQVSFRDRCFNFNISRVNCGLLSSPVCGCNGVTYTNRCEALKAGLKSFVSGACQ